MGRRLQSISVAKCALRVLEKVYDGAGCHPLHPLRGALQTPPNPISITSGTRE
jgi:hypothetical protein